MKELNNDVCGMMCIGGQRRKKCEWWSVKVRENKLLKNFRNRSRKVAKRVGDLDGGESLENNFDGNRCFGMKK